MRMSGDLAVDSEVLVVDDEYANVAIAERILKRNGFTRVRTLTEPRRFEAVFDEQRPDVILLDLHMPGIGGLEVLAEIRRLKGSAEYLPTLILTGDASASARKEALAAGAIDFITKPLDETEVVLRVLNYLEVRRLHLRIVARASELDDLVRRRTAELEREQTEAFSRLNLVSEFRDDETHQHTMRVGVSSGLLAAAVGQGADFADLMTRAAPLHDIGKIGIPDSILLKPGRLTLEELAVMRSHCSIGVRIIGETRSRELAMARVIAQTHHERWDGSGYPEGLRGEGISLAGRIVAVCDVFDALIHNRPYKRAWSIDRALEEIAAGGGRHFDPELCTAFCERVAPSLAWVQGELPGELPAA